MTWRDGTARTLTRAIGAAAVVCLAGITAVLGTHDASAATDGFPGDPAPSTSTKAIRVMALGDSITEAPDTDYPALTGVTGWRCPLQHLMTQRGIRFDFVGSRRSAPPDDPACDPDHEGHSGYTLGPGQYGSLLSIAQQITAAARPDVVLVLAGTNDYIVSTDTGYDPDVDGPARLGKLLDAIHAGAPDAVVLVATVLPREGRPGYADAFNAGLPAIVQARPFTRLVPMRDSVEFNPGDWVDGLHPSDSGYAQVARTWMTAVDKVLG